MSARARCRIPGNTVVPPMSRAGVQPGSAAGWMTSSGDGKLKLWDVASGQEVYTLSDTTGSARGDWNKKRHSPGRETSSEQAAFSPSGDRLAAACVNTILLWNTRAGSRSTGQRAREF